MLFSDLKFTWWGTFSFCFLWWTPIRIRGRGQSDDCHLKFTIFYQIFLSFLQVPSTRVPWYWLSGQFSVHETEQSPHAWKSWGWRMKNTSPIIIGFLNAALYDDPPPDQPGPEPKKGKKQAKLEERIKDPKTCWKPVKIRWYDGVIHSRCFPVLPCAVLHTRICPSSY